MFLLAAVFVCWLMGFAVFWRTPVCRDSPGGTECPSPCRFSIIIPARNERDNLPVLLQSIASQDRQPEQVIVVDDHSTDGTAEVARQFNAMVLPSAALPDGWRGKTWACHQGAAVASADHLLFLDADTQFASGGLKKIVDNYAANPDAAMSVLPYHVVPRAYEQLSAFFNLIMTAGIGAFAIWPSQNHGLFGQMLMVSRKNYYRAGGHERVKGRILENLWLARHFREHQTPLRCFLGKGALWFRMYPGGIGQLIEGWTKGFASGSQATPPIVLLMIIAWLSGATPPVGLMMLIAVLRGPTSAMVLFTQTGLLIAIAFYALYASQIFLLLRRIGSFRVYTALLFPVALLFFFVVFARSAIRSRTSVAWKGRVIRAD